MGWEPRYPAIPAVAEVEIGNRRTSVVRLLPNGFQGRRLLKLADASAKLFNELNYERRQQFFKAQKKTSRAHGTSITGSIRIFSVLTLRV